MNSEQLVGRVEHKEEFSFQKYMSNSIPVNEYGSRQAAQVVNVFFSAIG